METQSQLPPRRNLTTEQRTSLDLTDQIRGWGADLDPNVRPGVPRDKSPQLGIETLYPPIKPQVPRFKIHQSTEHGRLTPIFGTSSPPQFVSGWMRDYAYTLSEGRLSHWLILMAADRVNVLEDLVNDFAHGHVPNLYKEMGLAAEWKYNRKGVLKTLAILGIGVAGYVFWRRNREGKPSLEARKSQLFGS